MNKSGKISLYTIIIFGAVCLILFSSLVPAPSSDYTKSYDSSKKTASFTKISNGVNVLNLTLETPETYVVSEQGNIKQLVASFKAKNFDDITENFTITLNFTNLKTGQPISRDYEVKKEIIAGSKTIDSWETQCNPFTAPNLSVVQNCSGVLTSQSVSDYQWVSLDAEEFEWVDKPNGKGKIKKITKNTEKHIGIFVDIQKGDMIEWIPILQDNLNLTMGDISEWAVWSEYNNNNNKVVFYKLNAVNNTANVINEVPNQPNGTFAGFGALVSNYVPSALTGYSNSSLFHIPTFHSLNTTLLPNATLGGNFTIEWRMNKSATGADMFFDWGLMDGTGVSLATDGNGQTSIALDGGCGQTNANGQAIDDGKWHHLVFQRNDTTFRYYIDGVLKTTRTCSLGAMSQHPLAFGFDYNGYWGSNHFNGEIDQIIVWDRLLTPAEIESANASTGEGTPSDTTRPLVTSLLETPSDPQSYLSGRVYEFNATITDETGLTNVLFEWNGTTNYTARNLTANMYNFSGISDLSASTYNYRWIANDTSGNLNSTETGTYTINRASVVPTLFLNGTEHQQLNITFPSQINATFNTSIVEQRAVMSLYRNGTDVTAQNGSNIQLAVGLWNYTLVVTQTQNYSLNYRTRNLNIQQGTPTARLYVNGSRANITFDIGEQIWLNATLETGYASFQGGNINLTLGSLQLNNSGSTNITRLYRFNESGIFRINNSYSGNQNWTGGSDEWYVNVSNIKVLLDSNNILNNTGSNSSITFNSVATWADLVRVTATNIELNNASFTNGELVVNITPATPINWSRANRNLDSSNFIYLSSSSNTKKVIYSELPSIVNATLNFNIVTSSCTSSSISRIEVIGNTTNYARNYTIEGDPDVSCLASGKLTLRNVQVENTTASTNIEIFYSGGGGAVQDSVGGGGGANEVVSQTGQALWSMETETGSGSYEFNMLQGSLRERDILFKNAGVSSIKVKMNCEGEVCLYVNFTDKEVNLPLSKDVITRSSFTIKMPKDILPDTYFGNIVATDQNGNRGIITLKITIGKAGIITEIIEKLKSNKVITDAISIPYSILAIAVAILIGAFGRLILFAKVKEFRGGLSVLVSVISFMFVLLII